MWNKNYVEKIIIYTLDWFKHQYIKYITAVDWITWLESKSWPVNKGVNRHNCNGASHWSILIEWRHTHVATWIAPTLNHCHSEEGVESDDEATPGCLCLNIFSQFLVDQEEMNFDFIICPKIPMFMTARPVLVIKANFLQLNIQTQICFIIAENRRESQSVAQESGKERPRMSVDLAKNVNTPHRIGCQSRDNLVIGSY